MNLNDILKAWQEGSLPGYTIGHLRAMSQRCIVYILNRYPEAAHAKDAIDEEIRRREARTAPNATYTIMGDHYSAGQAGAIGPQASAHDMTFHQISAEQLGHIDMRTLAAELSSLRREMRQVATDPEQDI